MHPYGSNPPTNKMLTTNNTQGNTELFVIVDCEVHHFAMYNGNVTFALRLKYFQRLNRT